MRTEIPDPRIYDERYRKPVKGSLAHSVESLTKEGEKSLKQTRKRKGLNKYESPKIPSPYELAYRNPKPPQVAKKPARGLEYEDQYDDLHEYEPEWLPRVRTFATWFILVVGGIGLIILLALTLKEVFKP